MKMTTEEAFVKVLQMHGIEHAFGIIGSAFMPISDIFPQAGITFWDVAHETNGGLICDGYTRATGKMAMAIAQNGPGVTGFVGSGNRPVPLENHEVESILRQMEAEAPRVKVGYEKGQSVRITDGPFVDFMGVVDDISQERAKVKVLVSFFGRETPVKLDFLQVERA